MAIAQIHETVALSSIAVGAIFLLLTRRRSRTRGSAVDSQHLQILDRRLQELRKECLEPTTLRNVAEQIRSILETGREPLCLPPPQNNSMMKP
jgi:hypothetical protein